MLAITHPKPTSGGCFSVCKTIELKTSSSIIIENKSKTFTIFNFFDRICENIRNSVIYEFNSLLNEHDDRIRFKKDYIEVANGLYPDFNELSMKEILAKLNSDKK